MASQQYSTDYKAPAFRQGLFTYVARMSGHARGYDIFTPDIGELAFLADEKAPHPFYTRGFLLEQENDVPALLKCARTHDNCPPNMIVKGRRDYVICNDQIVAEVPEPCTPAMECIGGTGDIVTGLLTAYLAAGWPICASMCKAVKVCRELAAFHKPTPATQVGELLADLGGLLALKPELLEKSSQ